MTLNLSPAYHGLNCNTKHPRNCTISNRFNSELVIFTRMRFLQEVKLSPTLRLIIQVWTKATLWILKYVHSWASSRLNYSVYSGKYHSTDSDTNSPQINIWKKVLPLNKQQKNGLKKLIFGGNPSLLNCVTVVSLYYHSQSPSQNIS